MNLKHSFETAKKPMLLGLLTALLLTGCSLAGLLSNKEVQEAPATSISKQIWGMNVLLFPFPYPNEELAMVGRPKIWQKQITYLTEAKISTVRLVARGDQTYLTYLDAYVEKLSKEGIKILLILEDDAGPDPFGKEFDHGYRYAKKFIDRYGDKIDYYQLANEIGGSALKSPRHSGITMDDYDPKKLNLTLDFVRGAGTAVADLDPTALRVINTTAYQTGILGEAITRGIGFEIIGYNWGSGLGRDIENPVIDAARGTTIPLMATLKGFNKPIWLTEVIGYSRKAGETEQTKAEFVKHAATTARRLGIQGFFGYTLVEDVVNGKGFGFLEVKQDNNGLWDVTGELPVMKAYRDSISQGL